MKASDIKLLKSIKKSEIAAAVLMIPLRSAERNNIIPLVISEEDEKILKRIRKGSFDVKVNVYKAVFSFYLDTSLKRTISMAKAKNKKLAIDEMLNDPWKRNYFDFGSETLSAIISGEATITRTRS